MKESAAKGKGKNKSSIISAARRSPAETAEATPQKQPVFNDLHTRINLLAYELYLQRGCRDGHAEEDWLDAERDILNR